MRLVVATVLAVMALAGSGHQAGPAHGVITHSQPATGETLATAGRRAFATLTEVYYSNPGAWRECDAADCPSADVDWGDDSLTYTLALRFAKTHDRRLLPMLRALSANARTYPPPCTRILHCKRWSDVPEWDAVALADEYLATNDPVALVKAETAFEYVNDASVFSVGACPSIPYQQPGGGKNHLKTLETEANAVKAALLLYRATQDTKYLFSAITNYQAARKYFLDPTVPLYTAYTIDAGHKCTPIPHRFFASVNGNMIWSGLELFHDTSQQTFLDQATATADAVEHDLSDARGVFADLQAENDVVEPLVEAMDALAARGQLTARQWLLTNAAAALSARTANGSFGRFFDGPPPATTVTIWQTNGGLSLEIAAAAIAPTAVVRSSGDWIGATRVKRQISTLPSTLTFRGSGITMIGTLGEHCCEHGHARVLVDGRETFDGTGIWQNKSSALRSIAGTILFAWRWRTVGTHTLTLLPGIVDPKEGGPFLHLSGYEVLNGR